MRARAGYRPCETVDEQNTLSDFVLTVQPSTIVPVPCVHYTVHSRNMIYSTALYIPTERPPLRKARPSRDTTHTLCRRASFVPFSVHGSAANSTDWLIRFTSCDLVGGSLVSSKTPAEPSSRTARTGERPFSPNGLRCGHTRVRALSRMCNSPIGSQRLLGSLDHRSGDDPLELRAAEALILVGSEVVRVRNAASEGAESRC